MGAECAESSGFAQDRFGFLRRLVTSAPRPTTACTRPPIRCLSCSANGMGRRVMRALGFSFKIVILASAERILRKLLLLRGVRCNNERCAGVGVGAWVRRIPCRLPLQFLLQPGRAQLRPHHGRGGSHHYRRTPHQHGYLREGPDDEVILRDLDGKPNNGMHPTADTHLVMLRDRCGAAGDDRVRCFLRCGANE
jgi:hypothetical protein